jgi:HAD superfamily hydrolase (TIGR01509 family)
MPNNMLRAVAFDLDGLMFNTEQLYTHVLKELLRRREKEFTQDLVDQMMGRPARSAFGVLSSYHDLDESLEDLMEESDAIFLGILDAQLAPMPGLVELLAALERSNIPKAIATSSRRSFTQKILAKFHFEPRFAFLLTGDDVTEGKPHPEIYLKAAERLEVPPAEMLVLEDSHNGCRAAVAAGAFAVAVPGEHSRNHDFTGAAFIAEGLADRRIYEALGVVDEAK